MVKRLKKRFYFVAAGYFRVFASLALRRWHPRVIAVTGSVGKTTMLHLLEFELGRRAHYSHDANSAFGISFDLLGMEGIRGSKWRWIRLVFEAPFKALFYRREGEFYVVEIDGERPRETEFLAKWLKPEITLWVSLGRSHAVQFEREVAEGKFSDLDTAIAHEFATLPEATTGVVYIDGDSKRMREVTAQIGAKVVEVKRAGLKKYEVAPDRTEYELKDGTKFRFAQPEPRDLAIQLGMLQKLTKELDVPLKTDLRELKMPPGRSSFLRGKHGLRLIDSSYNAHLISVGSILEMVKEMPDQHKWLVIGDIVDQGSIEGQEHRKLADLIAKVEPEMVVLVGWRTKQYTAPRLKELGVRACTTVDPHKALEYIEQHATGEEVIIFKGSQYLEWIIEKLLENPDDAEKLPRREPAAVKRRKKWGLT